MRVLPIRMSQQTVGHAKQEIEKKDPLYKRLADLQFIQIPAKHALSNHLNWVQMHWNQNTERLQVADKQNAVAVAMIFFFL